MTAAVTPVVHVPDEPEVQGERWLAAVRGGQPLDEVLCGTGGVSEWFWSRWRVLATSGLDQRGLDAIVIGYRRELWLWLAGERTWAQCCSGLIGRINRRVAAGDPSVG